MTRSSGYVIMSGRKITNPDIQHRRKTFPPERNKRIAIVTKHPDKQLSTNPENRSFQKRNQMIH